MQIGPDERVAGVSFTRDSLSVSLKDGRKISVPLAWYPRLLKATKAQRNKWRVIGPGYGIHWPDIDEDLSTEGLLRGAPSPEFRKNEPLVSMYLLSPIPFPLPPVTCHP